MAETLRVPAEEAVSEPQWRARLFEVAPLLFAALAFGAGAFTLIAVATPSLQHVRGLDVLERFVEELPELSASVAGVVLMGLATGLRRRVDAAWAATTALMAVVCVYAALRHGHVLGAWTLPIVLAEVAVLTNGSRAD